jgi:large conductance mechanosensitive channel
MRIIEEFKEFAIKGNAIELAVGIVIGTAFNSIIQSLVTDIIMPMIATVFGQPDFSTIMIGAVRIGSFLNAVINFLIIALSVFFAIKVLNKIVKRETVPPTASKPESR